jgi:uncharacterized protein YwqG
MTTVKNLVRELAEYALAKKGALHQADTNVFEYPHIEVPGGGWPQPLLVKEPGEWGEVPKVARGNHEHFAYFRLPIDYVKVIQAKYPEIRETPWGDTDGFKEIAIPLDAGLPTDLFKSLIDESYELTCTALDDHNRMLIEQAALTYNESQLIDRLIDVYSLATHRNAIRSYIRPAVLLRSRASSEADIPLGATKIGGRPDLPTNADWPIFWNYPDLLNADRPEDWPEESDWPPFYFCKPLAFLAQIDLAEIAKVGSPIRGLPISGLLSVFSVWGWDGDPETPPFEVPGDDDQEGWHVVLHIPKAAKLKRHKTPSCVNSFRAAAIEPIPILTLGGSHNQPNLGGPPAIPLEITEVERDRLLNLESDFREIQNRHWLSNTNPLHIHHQLGGHPEVSQGYPLKADEKGLAMFLQIASDVNTEMQWCDDGEVTFFADPRALAKGRFERVWASFESG